MPRHVVTRRVEFGDGLVMAQEFHFESFRLDRVNQCLWRHTTLVPLSPKAFWVLLHLTQHAGNLVTKQELLDAVWPDIHVTEGVLKRAVLEIRKALGDPVDQPRFIQTLNRRGYRFLPTAEVASPVGPVPESSIVGRSNEFLQLDTWFNAALQASRQIVFITGEAGLGKTMLVNSWLDTIREASRSGRSRDVAVASGRCLQQFGSGEPYLPVFEVLDQLSRSPGLKLIDVLRSRAPTWLLHMPALITPEDRGRLREEVFGSTRERMLREITDALDALSIETPLVIALEDLHWSDPSTIDLLTSIANRTSPACLMIIATYRPADAARSSFSLTGVQHELEIRKQCRVLSLTPLSEPDIGEYLSKRFSGSQARVPLTTPLHQRTDGNPLYLSCLVDDLERSGRIYADPATIRETVPDTLQQMFERQATQLTTAEQEMLEACAVAGETFSTATIAAVLGWDRDQAEAFCEALVRRHVILKRGDVVRSDDGGVSTGYAFLHALCRDALHRTIPPLRRSRLHGSVALAEEQLFASDPTRIAAVLAGHFELAGDCSRAIYYLRQSADRAVARYSLQEAASHLERAFLLLEKLSASEQTMLRMDLLEQRALMRVSASDMNAAAGDFGAVAKEAARAGDSIRHVRALLDSVHPLMFVDSQRAIAAIHEALASQADAPNRTLGAVIDVYRAFFPMYLSGWNKGLSNLMQAALPQVGDLTDPRFRSRVAWMESAVHTFVAEYPAACRKAEESRQYAKQTGVFYDYFVATLYLSWAHLHSGDLGQAMQVAKDGSHLAARNSSFFPLRWFEVRQAWARMEAFDFDNSLATMERIAAEPLMTQFRHTLPMFLWLGLARLGSGNYDAAWEAFEKLRVEGEQGGVGFQYTFPLLNAQAECAQRLGDLPGAIVFARELIGTAGSHGECTYVARGWQRLSEIALHEGDNVHAAACIAQALTALGDCEALSVEWQVHATASRVFRNLGCYDKGERSRQASLRAAQKIVNTLSQEPDMQRSLMARVNDDLGTEVTPPRTYAAT
ncbi:MAG: AAA family ATPase [Bryobacteraceae bacterium]|nr:AAA family ATPase [Bryobacteraceae bacterium]